MYNRKLITKRYTSCEVTIEFPEGVTELTDGQNTVTVTLTDKTKTVIVTKDIIVSKAKFDFLATKIDGTSLTEKADKLVVTLDGSVNAISKNIITLPEGATEVVSISPENLNRGANKVTIALKDENGVVITKEVTVTRADFSVTDLKVGDKNVAKVGNDFAIEVTNDIDNTSKLPTTVDGATVTYNPSGELTEGVNTVTVTLTKGDVKLVKEVKITRKAAESSAEHLKLTVDGQPVVEKDGKLVVAVDGSVERIANTDVIHTEGATVAIEGGEKSLTVGENTVKIAVTKDGKTITKDVTVTRANFSVTDLKVGDKNVAKVGNDFAIEVTNDIDNTSKLPESVKGATVTYNPSGALTEGVKTVTVTLTKGDVKLVKEIKITRKAVEVLPEPKELKIETGSDGSVFEKYGEGKYKGSVKNSVEKLTSDIIKYYDATGNQDSNVTVEIVDSNGNPVTEASLVEAYTGEANVTTPNSNEFKIKLTKPGSGYKPLTIDIIAHRNSVIKNWTPNPKDGIDKFPYTTAAKLDEEVNIYVPIATTQVALADILENIFVEPGALIGKTPISMPIPTGDKYKVTLDAPGAEKIVKIPLNVPYCDAGEKVTVKIIRSKEAPAADKVTFTLASGTITGSNASEYEITVPNDVETIDQALVDDLKYDGVEINMDTVFITQEPETLNEGENTVTLVFKVYGYGDLKLENLKVTRE
ncbi:hypothetical protein DWQ65_01805 [Treponema phagedenis]|uniref:hypothetical protein n=1 Tax=Treponema phagedenis TaxID=162 RepID=UPI00197EDC7B|nr:hypothetical protein [Treponema phagedenis]QSH98828.1 hypothetical protein DWQ65_01805 [Treponema phagedenis]